MTELYTPDQTGVWAIFFLVLTLVTCGLGLLLFPLVFLASSRYAGHHCHDCSLHWDQRGRTPREVWTFSTVFVVVAVLALILLVIGIASR